MKSNNYHPIWYQRNRPYAKFAKQVATENGYTMTGLQAIQDRISREWNTALELNRIGKDEIQTDLMPEISMAFYYGVFASQGSNLFSFTNEIGEMLAHTKASEVPISAIKSPFTSFFIQFHRPIFWGKLEINGAYIIDDPMIPVIQVCLVLKPINETSHWMASASGYFYLPLSKNADLNLGDLIQKTIDSEIALKWKHATKSMPIDDVRIIDIREQRAMRETMDLSSARDAIQEAMEYVANCLCYLSSHNTFKTEYPEDAPKALLEKMEVAKTDKQKQKAQSQLKSMGHIPITYVRLEASQSAGGFNSGTASGKSLHWRRGHWRNQRKGQGLSVSELIWIKPTLVGDGKINSQAREYRVSK